MDPDQFEALIRRYVANGYRMTARSEHSAQLVRPKRFSAIAAVVSFLFFGVGLLVYLAIYLAQQDEVVYLSDDAGQVGPAGLCQICGYTNVQPRRQCKRCKAPMLRAVA